MQNILRISIGVTYTSLVLALAVASCSSANAPLTLAPASLDGLTCQAYDFAVADASKTVTWSIDPTGEAFGQIDTNGHYTAPMVVPKEPFSVVAQSDGSEARSQVVLYTAHPIDIGHAGITVHDVEQRSIATSGMRMYAAGLDANNGVMVARSDDAGKTFGAGVAAGNMPAGIELEYRIARRGSGSRHARPLS